MFSGRMLLHADSLATIFGMRVGWSDSVRYLNLDKKLNFQEHLTFTCVKTSNALCTIYCGVFNSKWHVVSQNQLLLYKASIRLHLTYYFVRCKVMSLKQPYLLQNKSCILIASQFTKINRMHDKLQFSHIKNYILRFSRKFFINCSLRENNSITGIGNYDPRLQQFMYVH